ncbi:flavonoid O-methyltransferase-like protein [Medicago truncatula]|uniref:isoflavone 7-O-methyltransferase n=1 Tax=Medicago truncatula TaxID=3880 RepID=G7KFJ5_MEDTR|nr:flavonoid O-methyltransferase-like protein [Medicago truncatula]
MESHNSSTLLKAQSHIWNHICNFINSMSLKCVVDLGIPDIIHNYGKPMPLSKLISSLPIHPSKKSCIYRLMQIMTQSGFFYEHDVTENELEIDYILTDESILLLKDHPMSVTPFLQAVLHPILANPWHEMSGWLKTDDPSTFGTTHGMSMWDYACGGVFNGLESLVDVGGGTGTMAKALAKSFPQLECTVFDLPHVVDGLQGGDNLNYVGGDMFKRIPPADAILLKWILHDWNDEECVKILRNCKDAIAKKGKEGKVIIIDMVVEKEKGNSESAKTQLFFDMLMMVLATGKERTKKEWVKLISSAGFNDYKITPVLGLRSVIEIYP